jgi:hypothetical protein
MSKMDVQGGCDQRRMVWKVDVEEVVVRKVDLVERKLSQRRAGSCSYDLAGHVMVSRIQ